MPSIAIVSDTDCSLPADLAARYDIHLVPINIHFEQETFQTGVDIDDAQLYARIDRGGEWPTSSAPSPGQFAEAYQDAFDAGAEAVVCFCVSQEVSATYSAALTGRDMMPERDITVVDSRRLAMGQGFMVLAAAEAARAGAPKDEIVAQALDVGKRASLYGALPALKYLAMSGRIDHLRAGVGDLLNVKPIVTLREGKLDLLDRVRTWKKARQRLVELTQQAAAGRPLERLAIQHVNDVAEAQSLQGQLCACLPCPETPIITGLTPGLSIFAGNGFVGAISVAAR